MQSDCQMKRVGSFQRIEISAKLGGVAENFTFHRQTSTMRNQFSNFVINKLFCPRSGIIKHSISDNGEIQNFASKFAAKAFSSLAAKEAFSSTK
jgi:hypothetical protein